MSTTTSASEALLSDGGAAAGAERVFRFGALAAGLTILLLLGLIVVSVTTAAWPALSELRGAYFLGSTWSPAEGRYGIVPLVYGTVVVSSLATLFAVPVSVGIALFMTEVAGPRVRAVVDLTVDLLAAVPSVVFGLWGFYQLVPVLQPVLGVIARKASSVPVLHSVLGETSGVGYVTAATVLALMITPIMTSVAREVFQTVPNNDRLGALALGATRSEMITGVVLPHSSSGLAGAVLLGLGRAMGETVAVALLIGASPHVSANIFGRGEALPSQIFRSLSEAGGMFRAALFGLAVSLFIMTVLVNIVARRIVRVADRRLKGT